MAQDDNTFTIDLTSQPGDHRCLACGHCGPVAVAVFPGDGGPVAAPCRVCAHDRAALTALIRRATGPGWAADDALAAPYAESAPRPTARGAHDGGEWGTHL